ncbi:Zinc finger BED domain-containing protein RICESLEEPER 3, partial [Bienertia sinuspersici]
MLVTKLNYMEPIRNVVKWIRITCSAKRAYKKKCEERELRKKVWSWDAPTQWNSTYKLLNDAIKYRDVLTELYNETCLNPNELINNDHWTLATVFRDVLATFNKVANVFSCVYEPNIHQVIIECIRIVNSISKANETSNIRNILDRIKAKCAGRRVLDEKISRLASQSIEMCIWKNDWHQVENKTRRRVLDEKISLLASQSIEMCACKKDWHQAENRSQGLKEDADDEDDPWMTMDTLDSSGDGRDCRPW